MDNVLIIRLLGFFFVALGLAFRLGYLKKLYWLSKGGIYAYLPMGLLFIWYSYFDSITTLSDRFGIIYYLIFGLLILMTIIFSVWTPQWAKPNWILWVEKYPAKIRKKMAEQAKNESGWETYVASSEAVDDWARKLSGKKSHLT